LEQQLKDRAKELKEQKQPEQQAEQQPLNPVFEAAAKVEEPYVEKRGGYREGAGRPLGMTDEKAKVKNLPKIPSNSIKHGAVTVFSFWSREAKIEDLALTDEEAELWSLPATQLQEYYWPGLIPEILSIWIEFIYASIRIMESRFDLIDKVRKQRRAARETKPEPAMADSGKVYHYRNSETNQPAHAFVPGAEAFMTTDVNKVNCKICVDLLRNLGITI